jgi:hypothetical protein
VAINNVTGTVHGRMAILGHFIIPQFTGDFGSIIFSNVDVDAIHKPSLPEAEMKHFKDEMPDEADFPIFSVNSPVENLTLDRIVTRVYDDRPLIRIGADAHIQTLNIGLSVYDPLLQAMPLKLAAHSRIERLNVLLSWDGESADLGKDPIVDEGAFLMQLHWIDTPPKFVGATVEKAEPQVITVTFSERVKASDFKNGVTVDVNGVPRSVLNGILLKDYKTVHYRIEIAMRPEDIVTWAYHADVGSIQNWDGANLMSVAPKTVGH